MLRPLMQLRDPVGMASLVAALRSYVGEAGPGNDFDREIRSTLKGSGLNRELAEGLLRNFEAITPGIRQKALGGLDDPSFVPARAARPNASPRRAPTATLVIRRPEILAGGLDDARVPGDVMIDPSRPVPVTSYTIRYVGFHCDAERGDFGGSDEVYLITSAVHIAPNGDNVVRTVQHPVGASEYSNVDAGDTRLGPIAACWQGLADPVSLTAVAYEHDQGDPDKYRDEVEAAVELAIALAIYELGPGATAIGILEKATDLITDGINWFLGTGDDQTDIPRTIILPISTLEAFGGKRKTPHIHVINLPGLEDPIEILTDLRYNFRTRHSGGGGRYVFGYDVVREPPFPPREPDVD